MPPEVHSHTGRTAIFQSAWTDESGRLFLATDLGLGLVHTLDMEAAATAVEQGLWAVKEAPFAELPRRFGHCLSPQAMEPNAPPRG